MVVSCVCLLRVVFPESLFAASNTTPTATSQVTEAAGGDSTPTKDEVFKCVILRTAYHEHIFRTSYKSGLV